MKIFGLFIGIMMVYYVLFLYINKNNKKQAQLQIYSTIYVIIRWILNDIYRITLIKYLMIIFFIFIIILLLTNYYKVMLSEPGYVPFLEVFI